MTQPRAWSNPDPPRTFSPRDFGGDVAFYIHGGYHSEVPTQNGVKPAARGTFVLLTGRMANGVFDDTMVWGNMGSQFIETRPGEVKLGRIRVDRATTFDVPSQYDESVAGMWVQQNPGRLEALARDAVANFNMRAAEMLKSGGQTGSGRVQPSPQFQPQPQPQPQPQYQQAPPGYGPPPEYLQAPPQAPQPQYGPPPGYPQGGAPPMPQAQLQSYGVPGPNPVPLPGTTAYQQAQQQAPPPNGGQAPQSATLASMQPQQPPPVPAGQSEQPPF